MFTSHEADIRGCFSHKQTETCREQNKNWSYTTISLQILKDWRVVEGLDGRTAWNELLKKMNEARIKWTTDRIKKRWEVLKAAD